MGLLAIGQFCASSKLVWPGANLSKKGSKIEFLWKNIFWWKEGLMKFPWEKIIEEEGESRVLFGGIQNNKSNWPRKFTSNQPMQKMNIK
jgi:hypothetical protein